MMYSHLPYLRRTLGKLGSWGPFTGHNKRWKYSHWLTIFTLSFTLSLPWMYVMLSSFRLSAATFLTNACSLLSSTLMRGIPGGFHLVSSHHSSVHLNRCHSRPAIFSVCENACLCIRLCHRVTLCVSGLPLLCWQITLDRRPLKLSAGRGSNPALPPWLCWLWQKSLVAPLYSFNKPTATTINSVDNWKIKFLFHFPAMLKTTQRPISTSNYCIWDLYKKTSASCESRSASRESRTCCSVLSIEETMSNN